MLEESVTLANSTGQGNLQREDKVDRIHVLAPENDLLDKKSSKSALKCHVSEASGCCLAYLIKL